MERSRFALVFLVLAIVGLSTIGIRSWLRARHDPLRLAALLEEAKGYTLGRHVASDLPTGGRVVFLSTDSGFAPDSTTDERLLRGLKAGCGEGFEVVLHRVPLNAPETLPGFLRLRTAGNAHLVRLPEVLTANPGCVAVVAKVDPQAPVPPVSAGGKSPPLYALGHGDPSLWAGLLKAGQIKAVQIDSAAGQAKGPRRQAIAAAAAQYYQIATAPSK